MSKASTALLLALALAGCAAAPQGRLASDPAVRPARYAWDGAGVDPNEARPAASPLRASRTARDDQGKELGNSDRDARVNRSLVICQGCLRPQPGEDARLAKASD